MAGRKKRIFDHFKHRTDLHISREVTALNNKYSDLKGYGVLIFLMELCGREIQGRIDFNKSDRMQLADSMNMEQELFNEIIFYLDNIAKLINISKSNGHLFLTIEELNREAKREKIKRDRAAQRMSEKRQIIKKNNGVRIDNKESESAKRKRIIREFDEILILTDRIVSDAQLKFPNLGDIKTYFKYFRKEVILDYKNMWGKVTHKNYVTMFYMRLNQYKKPLLEALAKDDREDKDFKNTVRRPIKFDLSE